MVRLPESVAKAKAEFEQENKIKDTVNNPRKILKDTPLETILDYANPNVAILCQRKLFEYNALALEVRTKIMACGPIAYKVAQAVAGLLAQYAKGLAKFPLVPGNLAPGTFGDWSRFNSQIPDCLKETSKLTNTLESIGKMLLSLFKGNNATTSLIDDLVKSLKRDMSKVRADLEQGNASSASKIKFVLETFTKSFALVQNSIQMILFPIFDMISEFLVKTGLGKDIADLRRYHSCLTSNCPPIIKYMVDMSDIMPDMMVDLPIDQYTGEFRPHRLFIYEKSFPDLNTQEGNRILSEMDSDYCQFCEMRKEKTQEIADSVGVNLGGTFL